MTVKRQEHGVLRKPMACDYYYLNTVIHNYGVNYKEAQDQKCFRGTKNYLQITIYV